MSVDASLLQSLFDAAPDGVVICDARAADWPVLYVNAAMEKLTGYEASHIRGRNLRFLQGDDHEQEGLNKIRAALKDGVSCQTMLRNYRQQPVVFVVVDDQDGKPLPDVTIRMQDLQRGRETVVKTDKNGRRTVTVEGTSYVESDTALVNRVLRPYGLKLADWQGASYVLSSATGRTGLRRARRCTRWGASRARHVHGSFAPC